MGLARTLTDRQGPWTPIGPTSRQDHRTAAESGLSSCLCAESADVGSCVNLVDDVVDACVESVSSVVEIVQRG